MERITWEKTILRIKSNAEPKFKYEYIEKPDGSLGKCLGIFYFADSLQDAIDYVTSCYWVHRVRFNNQNDFFMFRGMFKITNSCDSGNIVKYGRY